VKGWFRVPAKGVFIGQLGYGIEGFPHFEAHLKEA